MNRKRLLLGALLTVLLFPIGVVGDFVTNQKRTDGFGAQFQDIILTMIYAEFTRNKFVYTPIAHMDHNYESDLNFIEKKEWLMNLRDYVEINNDLSLQARAHLPDFVCFFNSNIDFCVNSFSLKNIKKWFYANKNANTVLKKERFNVVIHIRRPNVCDDRIFGTDVSDRIYVDLINKLRKKYVEKNPLFCICSQGNPSRFSALFRGKDIEFCINASVEETFMKMAFADVLVCGTSSFSYVAGWLCEGEVYYIPFLYEPFPKWININELVDCR